MMEAATHPVTRDLDVPETTFTEADLTTFLGLDALGLTTLGQLLTAEWAVIECRMPSGFEDPLCRSCGTQGVVCGTVAWCLAHVSAGRRPHSCWCVCDASPVPTATARGGRTRPVWLGPEPAYPLRGPAGAVQALGCEFMSVLRVAQLLGVAWHTASTTILTRAEQVLSPATRTASAVWMKVLGVDDSLARFAIKREVSLLCGAT